MEAVLVKKYRKSVGNVIDLCLTMPEISNMTAEEIFVGSCLYVNEVHTSDLLGANLTLMFQDSMAVGNQLKALIKQMIEELDPEG